MNAYDKIAELDKQLRPFGLLGVIDFGLQHKLFRFTGYTREQIAAAVSVNDAKPEPEPEPELIEEAPIRSKRGLR